MDPCTSTLHAEDPGVVLHGGTALQGYLAHKNSVPLGPYSRTMPRALWWSYGGGLFLMSEDPLGVLPGGEGATHLFALILLVRGERSPRTLQ